MWMRQMETSHSSSEGDAVQLAEHKTIIYDYLCPFPQEYEQVYTDSDEFPVPECTATDKNFYVLNEACFDQLRLPDVYMTSAACGWIMELR